jgi:hypothetical protein
LHIETQTFSAVSSQSFNDVFSSTYDNYRIIWNNDATVNSGAQINMRMRVSGSDNSSANYNFSLFYQNPFTLNTVSSARTNSDNSGSVTSGYFGRIDNDGNTSHTVIDMHNPFNTLKTTYQGLSVFSDGASTLFQGFLQGSLTVTTSYTGFSLLAGSGNFGGVVSIYGYAKV